MSIRDLLQRLVPSAPPAQPAPRTTSLEVPDILTVYGADWCTDCGRAKRYLESKGVQYRYVDLRRDHEAQRRLSDAGFRAIPIVAVPDGRVLIEPSNAELAGLLRP